MEMMDSNPCRHAFTFWPANCSRNGHSPYIRERFIFHPADLKKRRIIRIMCQLKIPFAPFGSLLSILFTVFDQKSFPPSAQRGHPRSPPAAAWPKKSKAMQFHRPPRGARGVCFVKTPDHAWLPGSLGGAPAFWGGRVERVSKQDQTKQAKQSKAKQHNTIHYTASHRKASKISKPSQTSQAKQASKLS